MRRVLIALAILGGLALLALGLWVGRGPAPAPALAERAPPPVHAPGARVVLRRPSAPPPLPDPAPPSAPDPAPAPAPDGAANGGNPAPTAGVASQDLGPALKATFAAGLRADLLGCVIDADLAPGFDGKLSLALLLDTDGLRDAAIVDLSGIPEGLRDCVADAVWSAEWPHLDQGEVDVTYPVTISTD